MKSEQICIETDTMSFSNYLECRNYSFVLRVLSTQTFLPIYKLAKEFNISWFDVSLKVSELLQNEKYRGKFKDIFDDFCKESHEELFETEQEAIDFYSIEENYQKLLSGDIGDNLLGKYSALALLNINEVITTIFYVLRNSFNINEKKNFDNVLDSSERWLKNLYMIENVFDEESEDLKKEQVKLHFDFYSWLNDVNQPINNFINDCEYEFSINYEKIKFVQREINTMSSSNPKIALGKYLMQQSARSYDIFEKNYTKLN